MTAISDSLCFKQNCFFFQAEDGIRDLVRSRGLGDVYKRQVPIEAVLKDGGKNYLTLIVMKGGKEEHEKREVQLLSLIHI